jgi:hypothetical protein
MRRLSLGGIAVLLLWTGTGCVGTTATPAVHGKAYVVSGSVFGTSTWNCDENGGEPVCWEVEEVEVDQ